MIQQQTPSCTEPDATGGDADSRRIRKRATDRKSQKKHRERQKSYIKQLEASIESLTSCKDTDERIATLLAGRDHYKSRYEDALARIARVRELLFLAGASEENGDGPTPFTDRVPLSAAAAMVTPRSSSASADNVDVDMDALDLVFSPDTALADSTGNSVVPLAAANMTSLHVTSTTTDLLAEMFTLDYEPDGSSDRVHLSFDRLSAHHHHQSSAPRPVVSASLDGMLGEHLHLCLPRYSPPVGPGDRHITSMLVEACREHAANTFDLTPPTLQRVLSPKADLLAFRLYNYIAAYGPMPMHVMIATFWVQYLLLRWHVTRSLEDFERIPHFFRPTEVERRVPHRITAALLVWLSTDYSIFVPGARPDLRRCLVRDALSVSPETVGSDLVRNLGSTWHPQLCVPAGDLTTSMDLFAVLETQAATLDFWRSRLGDDNGGGGDDQCIK
ncbi:hypothetical protein Micbo1qcDRAFT_203690 [Microdochium bolleyi]|uniref:BZIP domain-containing protein n=1 Tax=Microdochium bolleyi TaxID=196109 RepID=A0A136J3D5_9PEZI|nr:hypothetical protein Micbo1qcDRAFT_203690 [Microdochium bolleyi]